jgi:hypothetical protein
MDGIAIDPDVLGEPAQRNLIQGNVIGTDVTGAALGNGGNGVYVNGSDNTIGGTAPAAGNTIAFNSNDGVLIDRGAGNAILRNSIFLNADLGINLAHGGNNNQPPPIFTSATSDGNVLSFEGLLFGAPATPYSLEFFANSPSNGSGSIQGERFLISFTMISDASGAAHFIAAFVTNVPPGQFLTATATDNKNNTSEFSESVQVMAPPGPDVPPSALHWLPTPEVLFSRNWNSNSPQRMLPSPACLSSERGLELFFHVPGEAQAPDTSRPYLGQDSSNCLIQADMGDFLTVADLLKAEDLCVMSLSGERSSKSR